MHEVDLEDAEGVARAGPGRTGGLDLHLAAHGAYSWQADAAGSCGSTSSARRTSWRRRLGRVRGLRPRRHVSEYGVKITPRPRTSLSTPQRLRGGQGVRHAALRHFALHPGQHVAVLRLYSVFGPWEEPGRLVPAARLRGLARKLPPLVSPDAARDFVYVDDAAEAFLVVASSTPSRPGRDLQRRQRRADDAG